MTVIASAPSSASAALDKVRREVGPGGILNIVTDDEIRSVTTGLSRLSPSDAKVVVGQLRDAELKVIAEEMSGLSAEERRDFFDSMAAKLDGGNLARLSGAFDTTQIDNTGNTDSMRNMLEIAQAISQHSPGTTKLEFIREMAPRSDDQKSVKVIKLTSTTTLSQDPQARAIAEVLGGINGKQDPSLARSAIDSLSPSQLRAVTHAATQNSVRYLHAQQALPYAHSDTRPLERILDMAADIPNNLAKAKVFQAAAPVLAEQAVFGIYSTSSAPIRQGMGQLLLSDTKGMVSKLRDLDDSGVFLSVYLRDAIQAKDYAAISKLQRQLTLGNDERGHAAAYFNATESGVDGRAEHVNAKNAGYFVGALGGAIQSVAKSDQERAEIVTAVVNSALTIIGAGGGAVFSTTVGVASQFVSPSVNKFMDQPDGIVERRLLSSMLPREVKPDGDVVPLFHEAAETAFNSMFARTRVSSAD